jgi:transposase, IS30 family
MMAKPFTNLGRAERLELSILLQKGYSLRSIAVVLKRSPNTIAYEVRKNSVCSVYDPLKAHAKAHLKKRMRRLTWRKIEEHPTLKAYIIAGLHVHWNTDEIAGKMRQEKTPHRCTKTAIYEWLRSARGARYCHLLYSKRYRVKKRKPKAKRVLIPNRVSVTKRPDGATNRSRYGHNERDTIVGKKGTPGGLATAQERKSRLVGAVKVANMSPVTHLAADRRLFRERKTLSITRDNGIENRAHEALGIPSFFCDPYSSWQKGGIENANKMIRRYFPKGTDFRLVSQEEVDRVVSIINNKPRKILGYRSSLEVARAAGIINDTSVLILPRI